MVIANAKCKINAVEIPKNRDFGQKATEASVQRAFIVGFSSPTKA